MKKLTLFIIGLSLFAGLASAQDQRGYGLRLPTSEQLKKIPYTPSFSLPPNVKLPSSVDLSGEMPPVGDQGDQGSCSAFTIVYALKSYQERQEHNWDFVTGNRIRYDRICSPAFVFNTVKNLTRNSNCNEGIYFWEAFDILKTKGTPFWSDFPYSDTICTKVPDQQTETRALVNKISSYRALNAKNLSQIKYSLSVGKPVVLGVLLDNHFQKDGFDAFDNNTYYIYNLKGIINPSLYHAMLCVGYDDSTKVFTIMNSWGNDWGNAGFVDIPYKVFPKVANEAYTMNDAYRVQSFIGEGQLEVEDSNTISSPFFYSSWFKEGYYRQFKNIRMILSNLNTDLQTATVTFKDMDSEEVINIINYQMNTPLTFYNKEQKITFTLTDINRAGRNPFTKAAFFIVAIDESVDNEFRDRLERLELLIKQEEQVNEVVGRQKLLLENF